VILQGIEAVYFASANGKAQKAAKKASKHFYAAGCMQRYLYKKWIFGKLCEVCSAQFTKYPDLSERLQYGSLGIVVVSCLSDYVGQARNYGVS
jgi:hypothetical protein